MSLPLNAILKSGQQLAPIVSGRGLADRLSSKYASLITGSFVVPGEEGQFVPFPTDIPESLVSALAARGQTQLYCHQAEAWEASQAGRHIVMAMPTASGKSLCYTLPVVSAALQTGAKALYLFPTKALAQDQVADLLELNAAIGTLQDR